MLIVNSCKKSASGATGELTIVGDWELASIAGMGGMVPSVAGSGNTLHLTSASYIQHQSDTLFDKGNYTIVRDYTVNSFPMAGAITLNGSIGVRHANFYMQVNNTLTLDFGSAFDAPVYMYKRK